MLLRYPPERPNLLSFSLSYVPLTVNLVSCPPQVLRRWNSSAFRPKTPFPILQVDGAAGPGSAHPRRASPCADPLLVVTAPERAAMHTTSPLRADFWAIGCHHHLSTSLRPRYICCPPFHSASAVPYIVPGLPCGRILCPDVCLERSPSPPVRCVVTSLRRETLAVGFYYARCC